MPETTRRPTTPWRIWDLDLELRYGPVVEALRRIDDSICEIGAGLVGLARWVPNQIVGVDPTPAPDEAVLPSNLELVTASGNAIPLADRSVGAAVAVDTFEHVAPELRAPILAEMKRVTRDDGLVIVMGPTGRESEQADRRLLRMFERKNVGESSARWLREHIANGLPTVEELTTGLGTDRVRSVTARGVFNIRLWYLMHLAASGAIPRTGPLHPSVWYPVAAIARRFHLTPCYRQLVVASIGAKLDVNRG